MKENKYKFNLQSRVPNKKRKFNSLGSICE